MFNLQFLNDLRAREIERVLSFLPRSGRLLEIGAGTGKQAMLLSGRGFQVSAIELAASNYAGDRVFPVLDYDGRTLPFENATFDIVFSSNVLEHVGELGQIHREIRRVLKPGGQVVHVLPTHAWRFWTTTSAFPAAVQYIYATFRSRPNLRGRYGLPSPRAVFRFGLQLGRPLAGAMLQRRHGERGNVITETWYFRPIWWRRNFRRHGFRILREEPMGLFYTGNMVLGPHCSWDRRAELARWLGSACRIFLLESKIDS